jgi:hypothetical protein
MADIVPGAVDPDGGNSDGGDESDSDYGSESDMSDSDNVHNNMRLAIGVSATVPLGVDFVCHEAEQRRLRSRQEIFDTLDREHVPGEIMRVREKISANGFLKDYDETCPRFEGASDLAEACVWLNVLTSDDAWLGELRVTRRLPMGLRLPYNSCEPSTDEIKRKKQECNCHSASGTGSRSFCCKAIIAFMSVLLAYQTTETAKKNESENDAMIRLEDARCDMNVADFVVDNIDRVDTPGFVRLLRAHIFACASLLNKVAGDMPEYLKDPDHEEVLNALQLAARSNQIPLVVMRTLLEGNANVDSTTRSGKTSLMLVMCGRHTPLALEKVKLLLEYGANIDNYDDGFQTVLHHAADNGYLDGMRLVLEARRKLIEHENERQGRQLMGSGVVHRTAGRWKSRTAGLGHWPLGDNGVRWPPGDGGIRRPLYIDPLHMPDLQNQTPLTIATGVGLRPYSSSIKSRNERRNEIIKMLLDAGSDADLDLHRSPCAPAWENMEMRVEAVREERIDKGWGSYELDAPLDTKQPFLCHGSVSSIKCRNGVTLINFTIRKEFYDVHIWVGADVVHEFLDVENSDFDADEEIGKILSTFNGARFDFYESDEYVSCESGSEDIGIPGDMPKRDGADLDILFECDSDDGADDGETTYKTKVHLSSDKSPNTDCVMKLALRFPRGPYPSEFDDAGWSVLRITTTIREHLTCLQQAAKCPFQHSRTTMLRSAMSISNPLLEDARGRTAVQIMEMTLAEATASNLHNHHEIAPNTPPWDIPEVYKLPSHTDRCLLERMRKDHDTMLSYLNLGVVKEKDTMLSYLNLGVVQEKKPSIEYVPDVSVAVGKKRKTKKNKYISPFHRLPVDVCRIIHSFVVAH